MKTPEQSSSVESPNPPSDAALVNEARPVFQKQQPQKPTSDSVAPADVRTVCPDDKVAENFAMHVHKYITEFIRLADQKAAFTFAVCTSLLCYGFKTNVHQLWMKSPKTFTLVDTLCFVAMFCLGTGLLLSAWVIVPNLRKSHPGFVFFESIAEYESSTAYASEILGSPTINLRRALLQHTYDTAKICTAKYWWLGRSLWATAIGVILFVFVLLIK